MILGHRCRSCPSEVVVQHTSQRTVFYPDICESLVKAGNRAEIHFVVFSVATVDPDDFRLVAIGDGIHTGATERFGPVSCESLDMVGLEAVAERMAYYLVGHHPAMPGTGKSTQSVASACRLEDTLHASIMTIIPSLCNAHVKHVR
jgi:hypothetical protein